MMNNSWSKNSYRSKAVSQGLIMLGLFVVIQLISNLARDMESIGYIILMLIASYFLGLIMLIFLLVKIKDANKYGLTYFVICVIGYVLIAFKWLSHIGVVETVFKTLDVLSNRDSFGIIEVGFSAISNANDFENITMCMLLHFLHGFVIWILGFLFEPKVNLETHTSNTNVEMKTHISSCKNISTNQRNRDVNYSIKNNATTYSIKDLYVKLSQCNAKNRIDSIYWIFEIKKIIQDNYTVMTINFFNTEFNENGHLQQLFYSIGEKQYVQNNWKLVKEFSNANILGFSVKLPKEINNHQVEITGYTLHGKKETPKGKYIPKLNINVDSSNILFIAQQYYSNNPSQCQIVPSILNNVWICACGRVNREEARFCAICGHSKQEAIEMMKNDSSKQVDSLTEKVTVDLYHTIDQSIENYTVEKNLNQKFVNSLIDYDALTKKQNELIEEYLTTMLKKNPIQYNVSQTFESNISRYIQSIARGVITLDMVKSKLDLEKEKKIYQLLSNSSLKK